MIAVITVLCAFPLGFFLRSRIAANTAYAIAYLWAFVYQTLYLTLDAMNDAEGGGAFKRQEFPLSYGIVTLGIFAAGFGLVALGHWTRDRRVRRQESARSSLTGTSASAASGKTAASANVAG
jgi:hypothetical protein